MYRYRHAGAGLVGGPISSTATTATRATLRLAGDRGNRRDANGVRRHYLSCGRAFSPATGTVFDGRKLPVAD
ncbi:MAG: hypothetical protein ACLTS2_12715 [Eggerthella lenta]